MTCGVHEDRIGTVVDAEGGSLGTLGEPGVNVLLLNVALDRRFGPPAGRGQSYVPLAAGAP